MIVAVPGHCHFTIISTLNNKLTYVVFVLFKVEIK